MKDDFRTHTLKTTKDKRGTIVTLTPKFIALLLTANHDMVVRVTLEYLCKRIKELTGKTPTISYDSMAILDNHVKGIDKPTGKFIHFLAQTWLIRGSMLESRGLVEYFNVMNIVIPALQDSLENVELEK